METFNEELIESLCSVEESSRIEMKIFRLLRGDESQDSINKKLGYNFNQYAKWESGKKVIQWEDLLSVCKVKNIDVVKMLNRRFPIRDVCDKDVPGRSLLKFFLKVFFNDKITDLSNYLDLNPSALRRLLTTSRTVPLRVVLKLFLYRPIFYVYFFKELGIIKQFNEFAGNCDTLISLEQLEANYPFVSSVLYFTDTSSYKENGLHSSCYIAEKTGLTLDQVNFSIKELEDRGLISFNYNLGRYEFCHVASELNTLTPEQTIRIMTYWMYRGVSYLNRRVYDNVSPETKNHGCFRVFTTTKSTAQKINEKLAETYYEINNLIKESSFQEDEEDVVFKVMFMNCFGLEESRPYDFISDKNVGFVIDKNSMN